MAVVPYILLSQRKRRKNKYSIPRPSKPKNAFANFYTKFRASKLFLSGLCSLIAIWLCLHWWLGIDSDFGGLNLFLSAEASISLAFFTLVAEMQDKENLKLEYDQEYKLNEILETLEEDEVPAILERLVSQLKAKGYPEHSAYAIATSSLQKSGNLKKGSQKATHKGLERGFMSPSERAIDRASSKSGHKKTDYLYNSHTNRATLRRGAKRGR